MDRLDVIIGILAFVAAMSVLTVVFAEERECEDIKGEMDWTSEGHDDNEASEKHFDKMIEGSSTICEVAKAVDHEKADGEITDWTDFKETFTYQGTSEEVQECLKERFDLPDDGRKALQGYEIQDCATGDY
jgi:hypothetical protein